MLSFDLNRILSLAVDPKNLIERLTITLSLVTSRVHLVMTVALALSQFLSLSLGLVIGLSLSMIIGQSLSLSLVVDVVGVRL